MASFDLWLEGEELDESVGWKQEFHFNFDRFLNEPEYAEIVQRHIRTGLKHLAEELQYLEDHIPKGTYQRVDSEIKNGCE